MVMPKIFIWDTCYKLVLSIRVVDSHSSLRDLVNVRTSDILCKSFAHCIPMHSRDFELIFFMPFKILYEYKSKNRTSGPMYEMLHIIDGICK